MLVLGSLWEAIFQEICMAPRFRGLWSSIFAIFPKEIIKTRGRDDERKTNSAPSLAPGRGEGGRANPPPGTGSWFLRLGRVFFLEHSVII